MLQLTFWTRLGDFAIAAAPYLWALLASGIVGAAFAAMTSAGQRWQSRKWARHFRWATTGVGRIHVIWAILFLGVLYACFEAFDSANLENRDLHQRLADLAIPQFAMTINRIEMADTQNGRLLQAFLIVSNRGAPASIVASSWTMSVVLPSGHIIKGEPSTMSSEGRRSYLPDGQHQMVLERSDDLALRASQTIDRNGYKDGVLGFWFGDLPRGMVALDEAEFVVTAQDIEGRTYLGKTTTAILHAKSKSVFMPSLAHPFAELGCPPGTPPSTPAYAQ